MNRVLATVLLAAMLCTTAHAQDLAVHDLVIADQAVPVRLMGYGIVVGLPGTGDRASRHGSEETVQSIANILRRFNVQVPPEWLNTRNAAAVLVTAEVSPYLRPGGQFDVEVSSIGDARSLRGGTLWMTPLVADVGGSPLGSAQGALLVAVDQPARSGAWSSAWSGARGGQPETTARIPAGGLVEVQLPRAASAPAGPAHLMLRRPNATTATRIAAAINKALADSVATVDDPGQVTVAVTGANADRTALLARISTVRVAPGRSGRIVIDARSGSVVAGGDIVVGEGVVSIGALALRIGAASSDTTKRQGQVDLPAGTSVQALVAALHAVETPPGQIAAIFQALHDVGAISAELVIQ
ncbi:MAG TPA: flagellar basal body P-ring protein FlgI [Gemmatimonadaceae bacterium]|nr:flagellar basal body P-ring protein FlgI [Gemmatimonadaceae bacterium]